MLKLGNTDINKIYLGSTEIKKAYLGSTLVYSKSVTPIYGDYEHSYSLQSIDGFSGAVINARRSSDNATLDFTASEITDGTLTTWAVGTDAFVNIMYDQQGAVNLTTNSNSNQPQVISSGSLITENSVPRIQFNGGVNGFQADGLSSLFNGTNSPLSVVLNFKPDVNSPRHVVYFAINSIVTTNQNYFEMLDSGGRSFRHGRRNPSNNFTVSGATWSAGTDYILEKYTNSSGLLDTYNNNTADINNGNLAVGTISGIDTVVVGHNFNYSSNRGLDGLFGEIHFSSSDNIAGRTAVYNDISSRY